MNKHLGKILDKVGKYRVIDCTRCKFRHVVPIPTKEKLNKLYEDSYYTEEKPKYLKEAEEDFDWWMLTYNNIYQLLEKHTKGRKLLDIGSGPGFFLKCGQDKGWEVLGFEPSKQAYQYSREMGLKVVNAPFNEDQAKKFGKFDVVNLSFVLEHLPNPTKILKNIKKILRPGGLICIISPNDYNPLQTVLKSNLGFKPWWVVPLQHINYFDFNSLKKLLKITGFEIVELVATFPMEFFLLSGDNYVTNKKLGRRCHAKRKLFEKNLYLANPNLLNSLYQAFTQNNIGREVLIIGKLKKPDGHY